MKYPILAICLAVSVNGLFSLFSSAFRSSIIFDKCWPVIVISLSQLIIIVFGAPGLQMLYPFAILLVCFIFFGLGFFSSKPLFEKFSINFRCLSLLIVIAGGVFGVLTLKYMPSVASFLCGAAGFLMVTGKAAYWISGMSLLSLTFVGSISFALLALASLMMNDYTLATLMTLMALALLLKSRVISPTESRFDDVF